MRQQVAVGQWHVLRDGEDGAALQRWSARQGRTVGRRDVDGAWCSVVLLEREVAQDGR